jgi:hypothetical protein
VSKRELKKYLHELKKDQLEDQILDLYSRFKDVKVYYNFAFNPKEEKLVEEAKFKISREYFPEKRRKPKMRRSVAHKYFRHFKTIGLSPALLADLMLYNIEIAQSYSAEKRVTQESFYISMFRSFQESKEFITTNGLYPELESRCQHIVETAWNQNWFNKTAFENEMS